ncbi:hypothetical protein G9F72_021050 [Clostridium estertheticum]|uniref:hypothetical protein n=1 Tax=Clostridium estertheticum TaxID=238834 RepID=UPI0013E9366F|nr:hypothetical protein [Clostridium estertheticum]MBZ9688812.1 hypothetical protein [Clostridium estertheticum]
MNFTKKTIAILTLGVFITGNSILASANTMSGPKNDTNLKIQAISQKNPQMNFNSTEGIVSDVKSSESRFQFTFKNDKSNNEINDKIILNVNNDTEIISSNDGKKLNISDIKDGVKVKAYYGPAVTASIPPMSTANMIIVEQGEDKCGSCNYGIITDVSLMKENKETTKDKTDKGRKEIMALMNNQIDTNLMISEKTKIVDSETGKVVSYKDIKKGVRVIAYYNITTMSMPPIATPQKIVILSNKQDKELSATATGLISDINILEGSKNELMISVKGEKSKDNIYGDINFIINSKTEIISDKSGNKLTIEAIKNDANVKVYYDGMLSKSLPPIGVAKKIVISETKYEMGTIGTVDNIYTSEDKKESRIEIKGERIGESGFDNIILNISEKTKIVDFKTGVELKAIDIKKDSKVAAYYGGILTRSLPPIGFAEKIVLIKQ